MKWWHWTLIFLGGAALLRNKAPAATSPHPDAGSPLGASLTAYLDAIQQYHADAIGGDGSFIAVYDAARNYIVVSYIPAAVEGVIPVAVNTEQPWSFYFTKLFDPTTCEKNSAGRCRYAP